MFTSTYIFCFIQKQIRTELSNNLIISDKNNFQGVVVTGSVLKLLCLKYQKTLEKLCLLGALVPSQDIFTSFQAISKFWLTKKKSIFLSLF